MFLVTLVWDCVGTTPKLSILYSVTRIQTLLLAFAITFTSFWVYDGERSTFTKSGLARYKAGWEESIFIFDYPSTDQRLCNTVTLQGLLIAKGCLSGHHRESNVKHPVHSTIRYQDEKRRRGSGGRQWELVCLNDLCKFGRDEILIISAEVRACPGFRPSRHLKRKHPVHQAGWSVHIW